MAPTPDLSLPAADHMGYRPQTTFGGILSFMRRDTTRDLRGVDVAVSGIPLDLATTYRSGARMGPAAIRAISAQLNEKLHPWGFGPCDRLSVIDYGDCALDPHQPLTIFPAIVEHARSILASGATMLTLGGDHFISYPLLKAHVEQRGRPLALIHFDAHCDTWADEAAGSLNHGTMFYKAVKEGLIDVAHSVQVGIRTWNDDFLGLRVLGADEVHSLGPAAIAQTILEVVGDAPAYLSFDIDCLDPAYAPGTGTPEPGGMTSNQVLSILEELADLPFIGMDCVEVSPPYDHAELTSQAAAHFVWTYLCGQIATTAKRSSS